MADSRVLLRYAVALLVIAASLRAGESHGLAAGPCGTTSVAPATYQHVIWIWMENHSYNQVIDNAAAPYTTQLAHQCGTATSYAAVGSPSLPNYIGATAGSTLGIADDRPPSAHVLSADNLFRQVRDGGMTEKSYVESMPANCTLTSSGTYAVRHNPAAYFAGRGDRVACQADDVPMGTASSGDFLADVSDDTLPNFAFVTPNLCSSTHDCSVNTGDLWLQKWLPLVLNSPAYLSGNTAVIIVWDEETPMPNVFITPPTVPGTVSGVAFNHYSLLRTTEDMLGIVTYLGNAGAAPGMRSAFESPGAPGIGGSTAAPDVAGPPTGPSTPESRAIWYLVGASMLAAGGLAAVAAWYAHRHHS